MSELKEFDDTVHDEDEYETPYQLFLDLCRKYKIQPQLDVAATGRNTKTEEYLDDALIQPWDHHGLDVWCNPPHSKTREFVYRAYSQWHAHNINIMMIMPTNTMSSVFWDSCIEDIAEYHAIKGRITFLHHGKPAPNHSRNAYVCVIWRAREPTDEPEPYS